MSDAQNPAIEIYESPTFKKAFKRLSEAHKDLVDDEIGKIEQNPELGERKKGDLSHLWVHKFKLDGRETLLAYSWQAQRLELYLLNLGPHENFYQDSKNRRDADLKLMQ
ncbi:MAG TPA: type II toxin-antitoxin system RelE/ParE family toxin [Cellvibrio sp.]